MLQFFSLVGVKDTESVKVLGATDLELDYFSAPLDFHRACIFPPGSQEEVLDLVDLLRLCITTQISKHKQQCKTKEKKYGKNASDSTSDAMKNNSVP